MLPRSRFAPLPPFAKAVGGGLTAPQGVPWPPASPAASRSGASSTSPCCSASSRRSRRRRSPATPPPPRRCGSRARPATAAALRAVVVNAGNANACTGKQGLADAARMRLLTANHLRLPVEQVAVCSTGIIGLPLPMEKIEPGIAAAAGGAARRRRRQGRGALRRGHPHHRQARQDRGARRDPARGQGQARLRRQGLRHDQPQHGDHAVLRHLRRRWWAGRTGRGCCTTRSTAPST